MLVPGTILRGSYAIVRLIAQGGMGAVYLAKHQRLGSTVAVKETFFNDASMLKAFEREARLLASLRHAALPKVIDHFSEGDGWFLVMEFIGGDDFAEMLKQRGAAFPINQVMDWGDQLLRALEYLHKQTPPVIHRDIKPHNLKLTEEGQIVLLDFGLAKGQAEGMSRMTAGRSIQGYTPAYAPLEQIQGAGTDARSDLYSLAATLYHLMTGFTPADALSRAAVVVTGQPDPLRPPNALNPEVAPRVADLLMQAMSQNREQRPASASEMRRMLREATGHDQPTVIAPIAPEIAATQLMASEPRKDSGPPIITTPTPVADHLSTQGARAPGIARRPENEREQPEPAGFPRPFPPWPMLLLERLLRFLMGNRLGWIILGIFWLLIIGLAVSGLVSNWKSNTTSNSTGVTDLATPSNAKAADPALKSFDFDVVTVDATGGITDRKKGQARYVAEDLGGGMTLDMVEIPGGGFTMGSPANEADRSNDEGPPHQVTTTGFNMGKFEVTQAQWRAVASLPKVGRDLDPDPSKFKGDNLPVEQVSWEDAMEFCVRLSEANGRTYRLPSEAEWEYACRAGTTTALAFGETVTPELVNYDGNYPYGSAANGSAAKGTYRETTTAAGSAGYPNAFGLYDMHGNLWEWCMDYWHESYSGAPTDGSSWQRGGDASLRVLRGGSWYSSASSCRSASRRRLSPDYRDDNLGFRVVVAARTP
jgi:eukaryotic-like serine/threonine-protein kinase